MMYDVYMMQPPPEISEVLIHLRVPKGLSEHHETFGGGRNGSRVLFDLSLWGGWMYDGINSGNGSTDYPIFMAEI